MSYHKALIIALNDIYIYPSIKLVFTPRIKNLFGSIIQLNRKWTQSLVLFEKWYFRLPLNEIRGIRSKQVCLSMIMELHNRDGTL